MSQQFFNRQKAFFGLAVIASDVGAVSELVSDQTGWLIAPGSRNQLQQAIAEAVVGKDLNEKRIAARDLIHRNFTWYKVVENTLDGMAKILINK